MHAQLCTVHIKLTKLDQKKIQLNCEQETKTNKDLKWLSS